MDTLRKDQLEASLHEEKKLIENGRLKDDSPLDLSDGFRRLCEACRKGDLKSCQELITDGVNINARDRFDYTPLILASLCGHYEVVQLLLEAGALCERDTFQGERCLYNALNDRIRGLLLSYDYSKSADPLQPFASHITSLLVRDTPKTSDISVIAAGEIFHLHKFILSSRSPYFFKKLSTAPETTLWKLPSTVPSQAFSIAMRYIYLGEIPSDIGVGPGTGFSEDEILEGIDKISRQLEISSLWDGVLEGSDRRLARQRRTDEVAKGQRQLETWFRESVLKHKLLVDTAKADKVQWDRDNAIFADVLLRADEPSVGSVIRDEELPPKHLDESINHPGSSQINGIPIGSFSRHSRSPSRVRKPKQSTLFPAHRAMLIRSEFFLTMFSSKFREAQSTQNLQIIPIDCSPDVLEVVLKFLYTEKSDFSLDLAIDVLFAADLLLIEKLKTKAAVVISTLGNGTLAAMPAQHAEGTSIQPEQHEVINIYDVVRAGWLTRMDRLEEFAARYFAYRLEIYIEEDEFAELIQESASRIQGRQETDSIELLDEIRYYLSERFRLRFEDSGIEELMNEEALVEEIARVHASPEDVFSQSQTTSDEKTMEAHQVPSTGLENESIISGIDGALRTLDGELAGDEFATEALNYQILLKKIDELLERLKLDA